MEIVKRGVDRREIVERSGVYKMEMVVRRVDKRKLKKGCR